MKNKIADLDISPLSILIVEDNAYMQTLLTEILRAFRVRNIRVAADGQSGIDQLKHFQPDIVLCDWEMVPMSGLQFTRKVRTMTGSPNAYVPIILITAHTELNKIKLARDHGVTEFLAKPVSAKLLYERICLTILNPRQFIMLNDGGYCGPDRRRSFKPELSLNRRSGDKKVISEAVSSAVG